MGKTIILLTDVPPRPVSGKRLATMPTSSQFYGIVVRMYYAEGGAPPHFHALYGDREVSVRIPDLEILDGALPDRALALVREWAERHRAELAENWRRTLRRAPLQPIEPLD